MSLFEVGRLVLKIAGRDSGKNAVIVDKIDDNYVIIDGQTRRKKCNIKHLEPLPQSIKLKKGASTEEVKNEFKKLGLEVVISHKKEKTEKPIKQRKNELNVTASAPVLKKKAVKKDKKSSSSVEDKIN